MVVLSAHIPLKSSLTDGHKSHIGHSRISKGGWLISDQDFLVGKNFT